MTSGETNRRLLRRRPFEPALCVLIIIRAVIGVVLLETATATASSANRVERLSGTLLLQRRRQPHQVVEDLLPARPFEPLRERDLPALGPVIVLNCAHCAGEASAVDQH